MTILYNNLGIGGFLDLLFGQTGSLTKTYTLPATGATFVAETNFERFDALGLTSDPFDNWDSYNLVSQNGTGRHLAQAARRAGARKRGVCNTVACASLTKKRRPWLAGCLKTIACGLN